MFGFVQDWKFESKFCSFKKFHGINIEHCREKPLDRNFNYQNFKKIIGQPFSRTTLVVTLLHVLQANRSRAASTPQHQCTQTSVQTFCTKNMTTVIFAFLHKTRCLTLSPHVITRTFIYVLYLHIVLLVTMQFGYIS